VICYTTSVSTPYGTTLKEDMEVEMEVKHNQMILPKDMKMFTKMRCKNNK
jgi:hypothetical protein